MIYFAQLETGAIKIGFSENLETRLPQLEADFGGPIVLLATMPGDRRDEYRIHRRFNHLRFPGTEQFRPDVDLMEFIGKPLLVAANPAAIEVQEPARETIINMKGSPDYSAWLEDLHRKTHIPKVQIFRLAMADWAQRNGHRPPPEI
jgi:hypothetical protein